MTTMFDAGVGITTRNRPGVLRQALEQHAGHPITNGLYVIVDDYSADPELMADIVDEFANSVECQVIFRQSGHRLGIAKAKNACLIPLYLCKNVFLMDDDAWPTVDGWDVLWAEAASSADVHHSMYVTDHTSMYHKVGGAGQMDDWANCMGLALHYTRHALDVLGGYDVERAVNVYGYEHAQMSLRAKMAGLTSGMKYPAPKKVTDWVFSIDCSREHYTTTTVSPEEHAKAGDNAAMMVDPDIHVPLIDPLA